MTSLDERIAKVKWDYDNNIHAWKEYVRINAQEVGVICHIKPKNWSSSLDLMHELEEELSDVEFRDYRDALWTIILNTPRPYERHHLSATAEQKAQAWLKVKERKDA